MTAHTVPTRFPKLLTLSALLAAFAAPALAQETIKIGAFLSVTGPAAFLGDPEQKTLETYVEKINAGGGVLGRKLQLISYDDSGDAEKARTFAKRLIDDDKPGKASRLLTDYMAENASTMLAIVSEMLMSFK